MYFKDKNIKINIRCDKNLKDKLDDRYSAIKEYLPNMTYSEFIRKIFEDFVLDTNNVDI